MKTKRDLTSHQECQAELDKMLSSLYAFLQGDPTQRANGDDEWLRRRDNETWRVLQSKFRSLPPGPKFARLFRLSQELNEVSDDLLFLSEGEASGIGLLESAMEQIVERLAAVATTGKGNPRAAQALAWIASVATEQVNGIARRKAELLKPYAMKCVSWPVLASRHPDNKRDVENLLTALGVGTRAKFNSSGRWHFLPSSGQPHRARLHSFAVRMEKAVEIARDSWLRVLADSGAIFPSWVVHARNLPDLLNGKHAAVQWFDVAWEALRTASGGHPERLPELAEVGRSRQGVWQRMGATKGQQENQRQQQLRERLRDAFLDRFTAPGV